MDKYGNPGSWAMVTGGSDGIGLEYCHYLAKLGWNILMVSRNEKKMQEKLQEIKAACGRPIECKYIVCDFSKLTDITEYRTLFEPEIANLDIGIVMANAGWGEPNAFHKIPDNDLKGQMNINAL